MGARCPKAEIGVEVHASGNPKKRGKIIKTHDDFFVQVEWADGTVEETSVWYLTDVETKRRAAQRAVDFWK